MENEIGYRTPGDLFEITALQQKRAPALRDGIWMRSVGSARIAWGRLTHDELLQTEGNSQRLAALIERRYLVTRTEAERQVKEFLARRGSWA